ncbi:hypothetical protein K6W36_11430 [Acetobacter senegalensis]|uniref:hypothetical protein n=1 Tax=Acetobacter senegalensis TaxID=446692 RepID=UPI001EDA3035|nr:hypothetical protein [Acetobacter senegalensis]MCG4261178.1 hypothetical protein [Acetobacter senegalensis]
MERAEQLSQLFRNSLTQFLSSDRENIVNGTSERNLCSRLSIILERNAKALGLDDYSADVEYNRMQDGKIKSIKTGNEEPITIQCDLILHSRGKFIGERDNLICVEMKRTSHPESEKLKDKNRLIALTSSPYDQVYSYDGTVHPEHVCGYGVGFYLEFSRDGRFMIEEYRNGRRVA